MENLRDLGITIAQALLLKSRFNKDGVVSSSAGGAGATTTASSTTPHAGLPPEVEKELADLLAGLKITPKTRAILAKHGYLSAASLCTATAEELRQTGIVAGQVAEIKYRFNKNGPASGSACVAAASISSPHSRWAQLMLVPPPLLPLVLLSLLRPLPLLPPPLPLSLPASSMPQPSPPP